MQVESDLSRHKLPSKKYGVAPQARSLDKIGGQFHSVRYPRDFLSIFRDVSNVEGGELGQESNPNWSEEWKPPIISSNSSMALRGLWEASAVIRLKIAERTC